MKLAKLAFLVPFLLVLYLISHSFNHFGLFEPDKGKGVEKVQDYTEVFPPPYDWAETNKLIAHGLGGLEGNKRVTNSLEAFEESYAKGYRVLEIDLVFTSDEQLVARHDWMGYMFDFLGQKVTADKLDKALSLKDFVSLPIHGEYHPLEWKDVIELLKKYPDAYVVTDTKGVTKEEVQKTFSKIVNVANEIEPNVLLRIIPQIYEENMHKYISTVHPFEQYIYTLYQVNSPEENVLQFVKDKGIRVVTMPENKVNQPFIEQLNRANVFSYVHTINDMAIMEKYLEMGMSGVYSDYIFPVDIESNATK